MKLKIAVVIAALLLAGCVGPMTPTGYLNKNVAGLVQYVDHPDARPFFDALCQCSSRYDYCRAPDKYNLVTVKLSRDSAASYGAQVPVPRHLDVSEDFILILHIDEHISNPTTSVGRFVKIAAKPNDPGCEWKGSKRFLSGDVVCNREGYDYRNIVKQ
jgi:hypothetical protein